MLPAFFAQTEKLGTSGIELNMATTSKCTWKEVELRCWDSLSQGIDNVCAC